MLIYFNFQNIISSELLSSIWHDFNMIFLAGVHKSLSLYKEKRFTRLGYQSGALYDCIPYLKKLLDETPLSNLLVRSCRIYLENDFVLSGLKCLAIFTHRVTMPFLNLVEKSDQNKLCEMLPLLCKDLQLKKLDTLEEFLVPWRHVQVQDTKMADLSKLEQFVLGKMCHQAAVGVELQCKREYWESPESNPDSLRATRLNLLSAEERSLLPTNNLNTERSLAKFGYLAGQSASHSNKLFTAKRIRDDLVLSDDSSADEYLNAAPLNVLKQLDIMELRWTGDQKDKKIQYLQASLAKKRRHDEFADQVLKKCKSHSGPVTNATELKKIVTENPGKVKQILRVEIQLQKCLHPGDVAARPNLYKVNKLTAEQMMENLTILLTDECDVVDGIVFPCEDEIYEILTIESAENS